MTHSISDPELASLVERIESKGLGWRLFYDVDGRCYSAEMWWWEGEDYRKVYSGVCCETILSALRRTWLKVPVRIAGALGGV